MTVSPTARHDSKCISGGVTPPGPPPPPPPPGPCTDAEGCSLCGTCDKGSGKCRCSRGFTGANCELLNMGSPLKCGEGGLCMHGEAVSSNSGVAPTTAYATWGRSSQYRHYRSTAPPGSPRLPPRLLPSAEVFQQERGARVVSAA